MSNHIKYHAIAFLLMFFLFTTCKKDKTIIVNGTVVDETRSLTGISNATVYLQERKSDLTCFSCLPYTIATYNADASGHFSFSFEGREGYVYSVVGSATNYFSNIASGDDISVDSRTKDNIEVTLKPVAWLKLHLKNTTPFDGTDQIGADNSFVTGGGGTFSGTTVDTIVVGSVYGNNDVKVVWFVTKNGLQTPHSAILFCPRFDTTSYNINY